jgi:diguanylate cyclase (GGDEF)-like protein
LKIPFMQSGVFKKYRDSDLFVPIVCIALTAAAAMLFSVRAYFRITHLLYDEATQYIINLSRQNAERLGAQMKMNMHLPEDLAQRISAVIRSDADFSNPASPIYDGIDEFCKENGFVSVYLADRTGAIYFKGARQKNFTDKFLTPLLNSGRTFISNPVYDIATGQKVVVYGTPITLGGRSNGAVLAAQRSEDVLKLFTKHIYNGSGSSSIINSDGGFIIKSMLTDSSKTVMNIFDVLNNPKNSRRTISEIREKMADGKSWAQALSDGKEQVFLCFIPVKKVSLSNNSWYMLTSVPENVIMSDSDIVTINVVLLCLIILGGTIAGALLLRSAGKHYREHLNDLAFRDSLTKLHNKNYLLESHKDIFSSGTGGNLMAYVEFDINNLTMFNDTNSYAVGNLLLRSIGEVLASALGSGEEGFRIGGDHFGIVLSYRLTKEITDKLKKLSALFREQASKNGIANCTVSFAFGVYTPGAGEVQATKMMDYADTARKQAKGHSGDGIVFFSEQIMDQLRERQMIEEVMRDALKNGEFKAWIQPKVDMETGQVCGGEVLVRWIDREGKMRMPDSFVPVMEADGFICEVDYYMFSEACRLKKRWRDAGCRDVVLSVNMSRDHIRHKDFIKHLCNIADDHQVKRNTLEIELTESLYAKETQTMVQIAQRFRNAGFYISMDDFGSGYSSLNLLKELPIDVIKLDKGFLDEMRMSKKGTAIIKSVVSMANEIGVRTVCEGVETREQVDFLMSVGCRTAQGYFYSKPLPPDEFEKYCGMEIDDLGENIQ